MNPEDDFANIQQTDAKLAALVAAITSAKTEERDRKTHLNMEQALHIAMARAFADSFIVEEWDEDKEEMVEIEGPLMMVHLICDYLENTAVSIGGKGLSMLENILTAQIQREQQSDLDRTVGRVAR